MGNSCLGKRPKVEFMEITCLKKKNKSTMTIKCNINMIHKKLLSLLVLLAAAVTGAWADDVLNIVVDGTSATIMYDGNANNNPHLTTGFGWSQSGQDWDAETTIRSTITTVTIDGSCNNFSGTLLNSMFNGFSGLTTIKGLKNLNTVGVQLMEYMFQGCSSLTSIDLSNFNTASVVSMFGMFNGCSSLTTLDLSSFNTEKVKKMNKMFKGCSSLETIYVGDGWNTDNQENISTDMFDGCTKLLSMNTANPATDKTNAHTGEGGYLKVKPFDYLFTVADCDHGSGKVSFTVGEGDAKVENAKGAYIADEGKTVTMTITPDEGWVVDVDNVKAQAYTTWANAGARRRRSAPDNIQILGDIEFTSGIPVDEQGVATFTFTMPAANVLLKEGYLATSNLYLSKDALADKANIAVTAGETTVEFDDDGKSTTTVTEGSTVTTKYNGSKKIIGVKAVKKSATPAIDYSTAQLGDLFYSDGTFSTTLEAGKTPIGVIAYLDQDGTGDDGITEKSNGAGHGLVLCLKNAASGADGQWSTETSAYEFGEDAKVADADALKRTTNVSGYTNTKTLAEKTDAATKYKAAYAAKNYTGLTAPTGTTGWFLPSAQQWVKMIEGLGELPDGAPSWVFWFDNTHTAAAKWEAALQKAGDGNYDSMTSTYLWYPSSSEFSADKAVRLYVDPTGTDEDYGLYWEEYGKDDTTSIYGRVRPVLAF